jgi:hypothetical protein
MGPPFGVFVAGCGINASRPFGVSGVITMKIMISTRSMSISGTTFIVAIELPFDPTSIPIANSFPPDIAI